MTVVTITKLRGEVYCTQCNTFLYTTRKPHRVMQEYCKTCRQDRKKLSVRRHRAKTASPSYTTAVG